jgi:hypothetical protein
LLVAGRARLLVPVFLRVPRALFRSFGILPVILIPGLLPLFLLVLPALL